jgi:hypothetical protein
MFYIIDVDANIVRNVGIPIIFSITIVGLVLLYTIAYTLYNKYR